jgi:hypothetical protein
LYINISKQIDLYSLSVMRLISKDGINLMSQFFNFIIGVGL